MFGPVPDKVQYHYFQLSHPIYIVLKEGFGCPFISPMQENTTMIYVSLFSIFTTVPNYSPIVLVAL